VRLLGILHPGGAAAGAGDAIEADVRQALTTIAGWRADDPTWLPPDPDGVPGTADGFVYRGCADPLPGPAVRDQLAARGRRDGIGPQRRAARHPVRRRRCRP
jgi:hypothetical protein